MPAKHKYEKRAHGGSVVEITLSNGQLYRITFNDSEECIRINTVDGAMSIVPSVSNEVRLFTLKNT